MATDPRRGWLGERLSLKWVVSIHQVCGVAGSGVVRLGMLDWPTWPLVKQRRTVAISRTPVPAFPPYSPLRVPLYLMSSVLSRSPIPGDDGGMAPGFHGGRYPTVEGRFANYVAAALIERLLHNRVFIGPSDGKNPNKKR